LIFDILYDVFILLKGYDILKYLIVLWFWHLAMAQ
jgi:hypothetical protein